MDDKKRVFISYSTNDSDIVEKALDFLESRGISCWFAPKEIPTGGNFAERITKGLKNADMVLLMFSKDAQSSEYVNQEVETAFNQNIPIIAFNLDGTIPSQSHGGILDRIKGLLSSSTGSNMGFFLRNTQWLFADGDPEGHFNQLFDDVSRILNDIERGIYKPPEPFFYEEDDDSGNQDLGFFEKHKKSIIAGFLILVICLGGILYTGMNSVNDGTLNETTIQIDFVGLADDGVSYSVYGSVSSTLNDSSDFTVQTDFYDDSGNIVKTEKAKLNDAEGNIICQSVIDSNVSKVNVKLLDSKNKEIDSKKCDEIKRE